MKDNLTVNLKGGLRLRSSISELLGFETVSPASPNPF